MILIVDDDNAVRMSIALALRKAGYDSRTVSNEKDALEAVRCQEIQLAVLDMNLTLSTTGQQGIEMLQKFRILRPDMPVILITAWGTIPSAVEAMNLGAFDYMTKPWSNNDLIAKIKKALKPKAPETPDTLDQIERQAILDAMHRHDNNITETAKELGITRQALYRRLEKYK